MKIRKDQVYIPRPILFEENCHDFHFDEEVDSNLQKPFLLGVKIGTVIIFIGSIVIELLSGGLNV